MQGRRPAPASGSEHKDQARRPGWTRPWSPARPSPRPARQRNYSWDPGQSVKVAAAQIIDDLRPRRASRPAQDRPLADLQHGKQQVSQEREAREGRHARQNFLQSAPLLVRRDRRGIALLVLLVARHGNMAGVGPMRVRRLRPGNTPPPGAPEGVQQPPHSGPGPGRYDAIEQPGLDDELAFA